jgi:hypothetical protein
MNSRVRKACVMAAVAVVIGLPSCASPTTQGPGGGRTARASRDQLLGRWTNSSGELHFQENGDLAVQSVGELTVAKDDKFEKSTVTTKYEGTYTVADDATLKVEFPKAAPLFLRAGEYDCFISGDTLTLKGREDVGILSANSSWKRKE